MRAWKCSLAIAGALLALLLLRPALAAPASQTGKVTLAGTLSGAAELPGPGDTDGSGTATLTVDAAKNEVCYDLTATGITLPAAAAHIHKGDKTVAGPVVVPFPTPPGADGKASACATGDAAVIADIVANPAGYYVNVHTSDFPNGAVRGQLAAQAGTAAPSAPATLPTTGGESNTLAVLAFVALTLLAGGALLATRRAR